MLGEILPCSQGYFIEPVAMNNNRSPIIPAGLGAVVPGFRGLGDQQTFPLSDLLKQSGTDSVSPEVRNFVLGAGALLVAWMLFGKKGRR